MANKPSWTPKCPNHGCALEGVGFPLPAKGEGICPVSGAHFEFRAAQDESKIGVQKDKFGNVTKSMTWIVEGDEKDNQVIG